jgi:hypothetical protein
VEDQSGRSTSEKEGRIKKVDFCEGEQSCEMRDSQLYLGNVIGVGEGKVNE